MRRMISICLLSLVIISAISLLIPVGIEAQDVHHLRRMWPVEPVREDLDCHWLELYPMYEVFIPVVEYIDSDGDETFSIGDVIDSGEEGTYTIFWIGFGADLRMVDGDDWLLIEGAEEGYPPPVNPLGETMLTIWPEFGNEFVVDDFVDLDGNGFDNYDEILLNGVWYEMIWYDMDVRTIWEPYDDPSQPTWQSSWSAVKSSYR